jgi:hypothetical protein
MVLSLGEGLLRPKRDYAHLYDRIGYPTRVLLLRPLVIILEL